jgi:hypothetical protein
MEDGIKCLKEYKLIVEGSLNYRKKFVLYRGSPTKRFQLSFLMVFSLITLS